MLTVKSLKTGEILGFAANMNVARALADANDWKNWYVASDDQLPELELVPREPDTDPRNRRGQRL